MRMRSFWASQLYSLYCQLLIVAFLGSLELRLADGQAVDCTNILRSQPKNLSTLQPCVSSSAGAPVVLDGSRRFESTRDGPRPVLDLAFKSFTMLLLPPGASTEIVASGITGVRMAKPSTVVVQLLLAVSVQPTASLLLSNVTLETDCYTLVRYQLWVSEARPANLSVADPSGDVRVMWWKQSGITLTNCTLTCRRPPVAALPVPRATSDSLANDSETAAIWVVKVSTDVDLYNALALAPLYGAGSEGHVLVVLECDMATVSPLWSAQGVTLLRNVTITGGSGSISISNLSSIYSLVESGRSDLHEDASVHAAGKPVLDLQDLVSGVYLADGVSVGLVDLVIMNTGMVFGYAPVPYSGLGFVAPFLWFFDFKRTVVSATKPMEQLVVIDCDIVSYSFDVSHMWAWAVVLTSKVEPIMSQAAPFKVGVYEIKLNEDQQPALEFSVLDAYGMLYRNSRLMPDGNWTSYSNVTLMSRGAGAPLYALSIPPATTAIPVWTHGDLQNALALAQRPGCSPFTNTTTYIHLFSNLSLDGAKWPYAGYNVSCNITISGSVNKRGGTWLNFNLLARFITLGGGAMLTFRYLTLFNMPSQQRTYLLGDTTQMTLPIWPVGRSAPGSSLLIVESTIVLPYEEYRMLADVADGRYRWPALNPGLKVSHAEDRSMSAVVMYGTGFNMTLSSTLLSDGSGSVPYMALLGPGNYGTTSMSPPPPAAATLLLKAGGGGLAPAGVIAIAVALPLGLIALAAVVAVAVLLSRRQRRRACGINVESPAAAASSPEVRLSGPGVVESNKAAAASGSLLCAAASSNNSPHSECPSGATVGPAGEAGPNLVKVSESGSDAPPVVPPLHVELHQLILDFAREIEDKHLTIHDALGSGGFATVYRGTWRGLDVAVKVIEFQDRAAGNERLQARAMTEAAIAANIQHANIVTTYSYDIRPCPVEGGVPDTPSSTLLGIGPSPEGGPSVHRRRSGSSDQSSSGSQAPRMWKLYLIQEFCEVGSLRMALENHMFQTADGQPNLPMILRLMLDVVRGLQHLHRKNIVHGDLTPGNILLKANVSRPGHYVAKLADFGLSVKMNPSQTSVDNNRTGTPFYASPEVRQHGNLTKASDLFALGAVLWEMWHGRPCYQRVRGVKHYIHATGYPRFPATCPTAFADLAGRCLRRALEERPSLKEVDDVLRNLLGSAVSGLSSGSEGSASGAPSHEWQLMAEGGGGGGGGNAVVAAIAALGEAPAAAAAAEGGGGEGEGYDGDGIGAGAGTDGVVGSTSRWFPAALAAGFQAAAMPQSGRAGFGGTAAAAAGGAAAEMPVPAAAASAAMPLLGGVGNQFAPAPASPPPQQQQQQQQQFAAGGSWPWGGAAAAAGGGAAAGPADPGILPQAPTGPAPAHVGRQWSLQHHHQPPRLLHGLTGNLRPGLKQEAGAAAGDEWRGAVPLPTAAVLPRGAGTECEMRAGWSAAAHQPRGPGAVELHEAGKQPAAGGGGGPAAAGAANPTGAQCHSNLSLRMGTADEHFVTASGSNSR